MYRFTNKLDPMVCRICGKKFPEKWSSGGVGAICENCFETRRSFDLIELGIVRNIIPEKTPFGYSFTFESKIDGLWYKCHEPCGDWAFVDNYKEHGIFSVPVGCWELKDLYENHPKSEKCSISIQVYDPEVREAPFRLVEIDKFDIESLPLDVSSRYHVLQMECRERGYSFRFYTLGDTENSFTVVVNNYNSPGTSEIYRVKLYPKN